MNQDLTPEQQAAVEDAELQETENEAFQHGWNDSTHEFRSGQSCEFRPNPASFEYWRSQYDRNLKDSCLTPDISLMYMSAWESGASAMLEWLQNEASMGTDPLRNIGSLSDIIPGTV